MKNKKITAVVIGAALLANMTIFSLAEAATSTTTALQTINPGALTIDNLPTIGNFTATTVSTGQQITSTRSTAIAVSDTRGVIGGGGFTLNQTATDFTNATVTKSIGVSNLTVSSIGPADRETVNSSDCSNNNDTGLGANLASTSFSSTVGGSMDGGIYVSNPTSLVNAPASGTGQSRVLTCNIFSTMSLTVPAFTPSADYTSTIVFSLQ